MELKSLMTLYNGTDIPAQSPVGVGARFNGAMLDCECDGDGNCSIETYCEG